MCKKRFYYFAYGSNLLKQRIQLKNPSAVFIGFGLLSEYSVKFVGYGSFWGGAVATIEPSQGDDVYGAVWTLDMSDISSLDSQEAVPKMYTPTEVTVALSGDEIKVRTCISCYSQSVPCRTYRANAVNHGLPSPYYLDVILRGAIQCSIPSTYISKLKSIPHNGYFGGSSVYSAVLEQLDPIERNQFQICDLKTFYLSENEKSR